MSTKKIAVEFTDGKRVLLPLIAGSFLFLKPGTGGEIVEPVLLGSSEVVTVDDTTQELSAENQTINFRTAAVASVATLEDGLYLGQRLAIKCKARSGADTLVLTSATGINDASGSALTSLDFDDDGEFAILDWLGDAWQVVNATCTETA